MAGIRKGTRKKNNPEYESVEYVDKSGVKRTKYVKKGNSASAKATADRVKNMDVFVSRESDEDYGDGLENSLATSGLQDMGNGEWSNGIYTFSDVHETDDGRLQAVVNTPDGETPYTLKSEKGGSADLFAQGLANATSLPKTLGAPDSEFERNAERTIDRDGTVYVKSTTTLAGDKSYGLSYTYPQEVDFPDSYLDFSETFESKERTLAEELICRAKSPVRMMGRVVWLSNTKSEPFLETAMSQKSSLPRLPMTKRCTRSSRTIYAQP